MRRRIGAEGEAVADEQDRFGLRRAANQHHRCRDQVFSHATIPCFFCYLMA
jgi:hypothetical protein